MTAGCFGENGLMRGNGHGRISSQITGSRGGRACPCGERYPKAEREREECIKRHRESGYETQWPEPPVLELIPELKYRGSEPPSVIAYSLSDAVAKWIR